MPIRPELRHLYTGLWTAISQYVRFDREGGKCERCGRVHGQLVHTLPDQRSFDHRGWRYLSGALAPFPTLLDWQHVRSTAVVLATAHLDHDPEHNTDDNLASLCQWCHLEHDRDAHRHAAAQTRRSRLAIGDLFEEAA